MKYKFGVYTKKDTNEQVQFNYTTNLNAKNKIKFVNNTTSLIVGNNYNSIIKDLMFDYSVILMFTDVDTSYIEDEVDAITAIENLVENTNIVDIVVKNADENVIEDLRLALDENISYKTGIKYDPVSKSIAKVFNTIDKMLKDVNIEEMMNAAKNVSKISGDITPEKILEAYAKSGMYKNIHKGNDKNK